MSYQSFYPHIFDLIRSKYLNGQIYVDSHIGNTYVKVNNNTIQPSVTVTNISMLDGNDYIDLIVDTKIQFNSNGGTVNEIQVTLNFDHLNYTWSFDMCAKPMITVGSGTTTLNQRFITRFYKQQQ